MTRLRFTILQVLLIAGLVALWLSGPLADVLAGDSRWYVLAVATIGGAGLVLTAFGRIEDASRVQDILPIVAVVAMQVGILSALAVMAQALMSAGDPSKAVGGFFSALSTALYVSVAALCGYLWLRLTLWLAHGE
jgi:uncharacterized membrane protein